MVTFYLQSPEYFSSTARLSRPSWVRMQSVRGERDAKRAIAETCRSPPFLVCGLVWRNSNIKTGESTSSRLLT
eukprot:816718-Prorocentrum_minimum.AAC.1